MNLSVSITKQRKSEITTYRKTIMTLINAIIFANEYIRYIVRIRNEFICKYKNTMQVRIYHI